MPRTCFRIKTVSIAPFLFVSFMVGLRQTFQSGNAVPPNDTEYNQPYCNENDSIYPIHLNQATDKMDTITFYRRLVQENIGYEDLGRSLSSNSRS